ncbi:GroES-like protein [Periconia macrospinosa]|uniref:GroES-like protein n=1 Tax=Periconia macrospinosa TaxID=97972 RepID=A0A2V1D236_9PLEO|nr:GroES-like protein [Periconia macrospinosa]
MKAWTTPIPLPHPGLDASMTLDPTHPLPTPTNPNHVQIRIHSASLNPADHKVPETPFLSRFAVSNPYIPGQDFSGVVTALGSSITDLTIGDAVFGSTCGDQMGKGTLAEYVVVTRAMVAKIPDVLNGRWDDLAGIGIAGLTALHAIAPNVKEGDKVFVNGGSGGTGVFSIQIAKALGCFVTTTCSTRNIELCRSLGADEVLDYTKVNVVDVMKGKGKVYKLVVDNVGSPADLYRASNAFTTDAGGGATFVQVGVSASLQQLRMVGGNLLRPGFLGGGKAKYDLILAKITKETPGDLERIARWMVEGKVRTVVDETFEFEGAAKGFGKLKTGRARGKVVVRVREGEE